MMNDFFHISERLHERYYKIKHKSGLTVLVFPKKLTTLHAVLGVNFGSADLAFIKNSKKIVLPIGTAHFLEHKLFDNEDGVSSEEIFAAMGAEANAYTSYATTRYLFSTTKRFDECLSELLRMVFNPYFTPESVQKEQGIIGQEISMYDDDPYERVMESCLAAMYYESGIRESICGSTESIAKIDDKLLHTVHKAFYVPENMMLSVCGNITPEQVLEAVERELGKRKFAPTAGFVSFCEPTGVVKHRTEQYMNVARPLFFLGVKDRMIPFGKESLRRSLTMTVLNNMLFSGTGELYNELLAERLITPSFSFGYSSGRVGCMNYFSGNSDDPDAVVERIFAEMKRAARGELSKDDFIRCRRSLLASYYKAFDSTAVIADDIMYSYIIEDTDPFAVPDIIESISFEETAASAAEVFGDEDKTVLSLILPLS